MAHNLQTMDARTSLVQQRPGTAASGPRVDITLDYVVPGGARAGSAPPESIARSVSPSLEHAQQQLQRAQKQAGPHLRHLERDDEDMQTMNARRDATRAANNEDSPVSSEEISRLDDDGVDYGRKHGHARGRQRRASGDTDDEDDGGSELHRYLDALRHRKSVVEGSGNGRANDSGNTGDSNRNANGPKLDAKNAVFGIRSTADYHPRDLDAHMRHIHFASDVLDDVGGMRGVKPRASSDLLTNAYGGALVNGVDYDDIVADVDEASASATASAFPTDIHIEDDRTESITEDIEVEARSTTSTPIRTIAEMAAVAMREREARGCHDGDVDDGDEDVNDGDDDEEAYEEDFEQEEEDGEEQEAEEEDVEDDESTVVEDKKQRAPVVVETLMPSHQTASAVESKTSAPLSTTSHLNATSPTTSGGPQLCAHPVYFVPAWPGPFAFGGPAGMPSMGGYHPSMIPGMYTPSGATSMMQAPFAHSSPCETTMSPSTANPIPSQTTHQAHDASNIESLLTRTTSSSSRSRDASLASALATLNPNAVALQNMMHGQLQLIEEFIAMNRAMTQAQLESVRTMRVCQCRVAGVAVSRLHSIYSHFAPKLKVHTWRQTYCDEIMT